MTRIAHDIRIARADNDVHKGIFVHELSSSRLRLHQHALLGVNRRFASAFNRWWEAVEHLRTPRGPWRSTLRDAWGQAVAGGWRPWKGRHAPRTRILQGREGARPQMEVLANKGISWHEVDAGGTSPSRTEVS